MSDSDDVERKIREMLLEMGEDKLLANFEGALKAFDEQSCQIDDTLDELLQEVDELLLRMDDLDDGGLESEEETCVR
jgi:hypothetical protein